MIEAGWKMSGILLFKQNTATFGTPEKSSSLRLKTLFREYSGDLNGNSGEISIFAGRRLDV